MYEEHASFLPIDDNEKIWHYMDFAKFCALIQNEQLFFSKLKHLPDPWEGHFTAKQMKVDSYDLSDDLATLIINTGVKVASLNRETIAVNCWHINDGESEAFWSHYRLRGVVIQSTFKRLKNCFSRCTDRSIHIGKMDYQDYQFGAIRQDNIFFPALTKRNSYVHENELRAVVWEDNTSLNNGKRAKFPSDAGESIKVDLSVLIESVYTSPFEKGDWFEKAVSGICNKYGVDVGCGKSKLMEGPIMPL